MIENSSYECIFCNSVLSSQKTLDRHQKTSKKCLIVQKDSKWVIQLRDKNQFLKEKVDRLEKKNEILSENNTSLELKTMSLKLENLSLEMKNKELETWKSEIMIEVNKSIKKKKETKVIAHILRTQVWENYIGIKIGALKCPYCITNEISQLNFECGHVIAREKDGSTDIENIRPICNKCNKSLGTKKMDVEKWNKGLISQSIVKTI